MLTGIKDFRQGTLDATDALHKMTGVLDMVGRFFGLGPVLDRLPTGGDLPSASEGFQIGPDGRLIDPSATRQPWQTQPPVLLQPRRAQ